MTLRSLSREQLNAILLQACKSRRTMLAGPSFSSNTRAWSSGEVALLPWSHVVQDISTELDMIISALELDGARLSHSV